VGNGNGTFNRPNTPTNHTHATDTDASRASDAHRPHGSIRVRRAQGGRVISNQNLHTHPTAGFQYYKPA
jgi:hypothetical protein